MTQLTPARIVETTFGFGPARVLQTATKLGLFSLLGKGQLTAEQIREGLGLAPRAVPDFTDALVSLGFLEREGDGPEAFYANTAETALFLDKASPAYIGGFVEMAHDRLYRFWGDLDIALKTGESQN